MGAVMGGDGRRTILKGKKRYRRRRRKDIDGGM